MNVKLAENDVTAGLGFIDMAKLCRKQDYQFEVLEDGTYLFDYKITI